MAIFDWFKRNKVQECQQMVLPKAELEGPTYLTGFTAADESSNRTERFEWRRKLRMPSGESKFRIKYYGQLHQEYPTLITGTDFAPSLVFAEEINSGKSILLFDGCRHGYNAMFCDEHTQEQLNKRIPDHVFRDKDGNEVFEIVVSAYYQMNTDEFSDLIDKKGKVELIDGTKIGYEDAWRNVYDVFQLWAINYKGERIEVISEELA